MKQTDLDAYLGTFFGHAPAEKARAKGEQKERRCEPRLPCNEMTNLVRIEPDGSSHWETVMLLDRSDEGVACESPHSFELGQMCMVELEGALRRAAVRSCVENRNGYRVGLRLVRRERRRSERVPMTGMVTAEFAGINVRALIRNVSSSGLQIETTMQVPVATVVRVVGTSTECVAISCYSKRHEGRYLTGLEIHDILK